MVSEAAIVVGVFQWRRSNISIIRGACSHYLAIDMANSLI